jgi:hypothetical protein
MILIFLTWVLLPLFFIPSGIAVKSIFKIETTGVFILVFLGLFIQSFLLTCCSFFFKIGLEVFFINFLIQIILFIWKTKEIKQSINETITDLKSLSTISKFTMLSILFFSLLKCAQFPFIIDNESYYLQTIKWINEYGFVKGLGNLHIFFAQTSPFHVLQAGFNFNFFTDRINDLNGFILVLSSGYFIIEFEKKYLLNKQIHWIGLIVIFNILFFQFINAPSPDLFIVLLSQIIFYIYLEKENNLSNFKIITTLFLFLFFIKITIAPIGLLILFILVKDKSRILFFFSFSTIITGVLILKNIILTGYPLFPFNFFGLDVDWRIPEKILVFISDPIRNSGYFKGSFVKNPSLFVKLFSWLNMGGINRVFNYGIILLLTSVFFLKEFRLNKKFKTLYFIIVIHFVILLLTSPQFRFFLPEFVFLFVLVLQFIINYFKISFQNIRLLLLTAVLLPFLLVEFVDYKIFTKNKLHQTKTRYHWGQILIPEKNSKYSDIKFEKIKDGNLEYNSTKVNFFFYGTGNGDLPCVNKVQIDYFKKHYFILPQQRTSDLKDGFYSKKLIINE